MHFIGIIPARYASTRFPGKPLADLCGKPVIQRVYEQASLVLERVIVATDDQRIYDCVKSFGGNVVMTSSHHTCGTDRVNEAYQIYANELLNSYQPLNHHETVVVNIQGDEPFIQPQQIRSLINCFPTDIATLVHPFTANDSWEDLANPNFVKVAIAQETQQKDSDTIGSALYFSRSIVPFLRGVEQSQWLNQGQHFRHIGMYAYRADVLQQITQLSPSPLEQLECLEQLRWLEHGLTIKVAKTNFASIGIDTPQDLEKAIHFLSLNS
ncbi:MAG: 3-deoxy-manno-octulosonate cytidylyltransferase [Paludibacteraceae bacterium]|jgi:3-deoxy-manno-octulosonate cytidylyltransferase (CMP-KDO synthetase)|nr:3-deoxy-manno-octulosonate cytidylyltransferase [Paludibacteraceae bacterium]